jgi:hypothetical protein
MAVETPIWLQNGTYPARLDRAFIEAVLRGTERVFDGLEVSERAMGASFSVEVSPGSVAIGGDDSSNQGFYFVRSTAVEELAVPSSPSSGTRTDTVIVRINDSQAGGASGDNGVIEVIEGTTVPPTAVALASIARSENEAAILTTAITDRRPLGAYPYTVSTHAPTPGVGVDGDIHVQVI